MGIGKEVRNTLLIFQKDFGKILLENADIEKFREYAIGDNPVKYAIEYYYKKPLNQCSLKEIIEGIVTNILFQNSSDSINYSDDGDHYSINISHSLGINMSKMIVIMQECLLKAYGVELESKFSERSVFFKVYKNPGPVKYSALKGLTK